MEENKMEELKPCPWSDPYLHPPRPLFVAEAFDAFKVLCPCGASGPSCSTGALAAAAWNRSAARRVPAVPHVPAGETDTSVSLAKALNESAKNKRTLENIACYLREAGDGDLAFSHLHILMHQDGWDVGERDSAAVPPGADGETKPASDAMIAEIDALHADVNDPMTAIAGTPWYVSGSHSFDSAGVRVEHLPNIWDNSGDAIACVVPDRGTYFEPEVSSLIVALVNNWPALRARLASRSPLPARAFPTEEECVELFEETWRASEGEKTKASVRAVRSLCLAACRSSASASAARSPSEIEPSVAEKCIGLCKDYALSVEDQNRDARDTALILADLINILYGDGAEPRPSETMGGLARAARSGGMVSADWSAAVDACIDLVKRRRERTEFLTRRASASEQVLDAERITEDREIEKKLRTLAQPGGTKNTTSEQKGG